MKSPLVTIIMPVYNVENYLEEALESIFLQTYNNIELIAVNDGSTDSSKEILEKYIDTHPLKKYKIINQTNEGLSGARNSGLKNINGKYTYFFDSDDKITPNCIEDLVQFSENNNTDIVRFNALSFFDEDYLNEATELPTYNEENLENKKVYSRDEFISTLDRVHSPVWLYFFKSKILIENDLTFFPGILHEDELFTPIAIYYASKIGYLEYTYFHRRYRSGSIMTLKNSEQGKKHLLGYLTVIKALSNFEKENIFTPKFHRYFKRIYKRIGSSLFGSKQLKFSDNLNLIYLGVNPFSALHRKILGRMRRVIKKLKNV